METKIRHIRKFIQNVQTPQSRHIDSHTTTHTLNPETIPFVPTHNIANPHNAQSFENPSVQASHTFNTQQSTFSKELDEDDDAYIKAYQDRSIEFRENKYFARLPWKQDHDELPTNLAVTKRRTENVIKRLTQKPDMLKKYGNIIQEQERRGFIERVDETAETQEKIHYIPHHPVQKESSTTPIRIVYDCSCRQSPNSPSLNDCLLDIPPKLNDLTKISYEI
ncbi:Hypothetical predicted protein [Mytilus galloprovincialis]|uniref:Uncharacterized protein n=1 Tax=Mytilus galloprovincialis TaxID=29158 RepID=A0A8B6BVW4_MYTGA|nr:Hypothetical predicted protein [Mytilus galloprovincialis]